MAREAIEEMGRHLEKERDAFVGFFTSEVAKLLAAAREQRYYDMYTAKKALCKGLIDVRDRVLLEFKAVDEELAHLAPESRRVNREIISMVQKDNRTFLTTYGAIKTFPIVSVSGYHSHEKADIQQMVLKLGGAFSEVLSEHTVTHLICHPKSLGGGHATQAAQWRIKVVTRAWLDDSVREGCFKEGTGPYEMVHVASPSDSPPQSKGALLRAVDRLFEQTQHNPTSYNSPETHTAATSADTQGSAKVRRLSRRDVLGDDEPVRKKRKSPVAPGTANTNTNVESVADVEAERMPPSIIPIPPPAVTVTAASAPDSQMVQWDPEATARARAQQEIKSEMEKRVFQVASTASVSKAEKDEMISHIRDLGGDVELVPKYMTKATHLVALTDTTERTEKYLSFVACGKWIVGRQYISDSHAARRWLNEEDYAVDGPEGRIATHRENGGKPFTGWRVLLLVQKRILPGIATILHAGNCSAVYTDVTPHSIENANYIFSDAAKELVLPYPPEQECRHLIPRLTGLCYSIEFLFRFLCISQDVDELKSTHALNLRFVEPEQYQLLQQQQQQAKG